MKIKDPMWKRKEAIGSLAQWCQEQRRRLRGPLNAKLYERICDVLRQDRLEMNELIKNPTNYPKHRDSINVLLDLIDEKDGMTSAPKAKRGRKSSPDADQAIVKEFDDGLDQGVWDSANEYLRIKHVARWKKGSKAAASWFSTLRNRVAKRKGLI